MSNPRIFHLWLPLVTFVCLALPAGATRLWVPVEYATIQTAIDVAVDGDSVLVNPGTYDERVNFKGKGIVVQSTMGPDSTWIDGGGTDACVVMWSGEGAESILDGFTLHDGSYDHGAGVHLNGASPTLRNLRIVECNAASSGGGVYVLGPARPTIESCSVLDCTATGFGGGIAAYRASPTIEGSVFARNSALTGGGIWASRGEPWVVNCTLDQNEATLGAHGAFQDSSQVWLRNTIASQSTSSGLWADASSSGTVQYCDVWGNAVNFDGLSAGEGCISMEPLFLPDSYDLSIDSPCIDAGDPSDVPPVGGGERIDIGAREYDYGVRVVEVSPGESIQAAIDTSQAGDRIVVAPGTYFEHLFLFSRRVELTSSEGPEATVIDAGGLGSVIYVQSGGRAGNQISGFTLRNGLAARGGGLLIEWASPEVSDLIIEECESSADGAGVYIRNWCSPVLEGLIIRHCTSAQFGGGVAVFRASPTIRESIIHDNLSDLAGGGIWAKESQVTVENCTIAYNSGGHGSGSTGGIHADSEAELLIRNTIVSHSTLGGGIRSLGALAVDIAYTCSWGNQGPDWANVDSGEGSFSEDPDYVDAAEGNFHLASPAGYYEDGVNVGRTPGVLSPCIDVADPELTVAGEPVPNGGRANLGAYGGGAGASCTPGQRFDVPGDYATINEAIAHAADGDTVHIGKVTMHEHVVIDGVAVSLIGDGPEQSAIDGDDARPCLTIRDINRDMMLVRGIAFREGVGDGVGGGGLRLDDASPAIEDCWIYECSAVNGGGVYVRLGAPTMRYLQLHNNHASVSGGALAFADGAAGLLWRSAIWQSSADSLGGAIYTVDSGPKVINCTIDECSGGDVLRGGGIDIDRNSTTEVRNCIFTETSDGLAVFGHSHATAYVVYCDGWLNVPCGNWGGHLYGNEYTRYREDPHYTREDPYYGLQANSPLIDKGDPADTEIPEGGGTRIDIGAYEYIFNTGQVLHVPEQFATIDSALTVAGEFDTVLIEPGTYSEHLLMLGTGPCLVGDDSAGDVVLRPPTDSADDLPILWILGVSTTRTSIEGLIFESGYADDGGGLLLEESDVSVTRCVFRSNSADHGGGVAILGGAPRLSRCTIRGNQANISGAGIYCSAETRAEIRNCLIAENGATGDGGGVCVADSRPSLINTTIASNTSGGSGGGLLLTTGAYPAIRNSIIVSNSGYYGVFANQGASAELRRNNVWGNDSGDYFGLDAGGGDMSLDPLFVGGESYDYHLQSENGSWHDAVGDYVIDASTSPCLDRGINPDDDPLIEPVPNGDIINLGYVGNTEYASLSFSHVYRVPGDAGTIQEAISLAISGDQILVAPGTYAEMIDFSGKDVALIARGGPDSTALIGMTGLPVVSFRNHETSLATLDGFSISDHTADYGSAVYMEAASPGIVNCRFENNMATLDRGGAILAVRGEPTIMHNLFVGNQSPLEGGAIALDESAAMISGNVFESNSSDFAGGAISMHGDLPLDPILSATIMENTFIGNESTGAGGGAIYLEVGTPVIRNNRFLRNLTPFHGGALYAYGDGVGGTVFGNLFLSNEAWDVGNTSRGGAIALRYADAADLLILNNTLVDNLAAQGGGVLVQNADLTLVNNAIVGSRAGAGIHALAASPLAIYNALWDNADGAVQGFELAASNLEVPPEFADTTYVLADSSALIDAGYEELRDGDGSVADIGAYSYTHQLELAVFPDSSSVLAGQDFGVTIEIRNPDLQEQGPVERQTWVVLPESGIELVVDAATLWLAAGAIDSTRVEARVRPQSPDGFYQVHVALSVNGVSYSEERFTLEVHH
jgi:hypothetical protein